MGSDRDLLLQSKLFDSEFYQVQYPDVAAAGVNPAEHYLNDGAKEGRRPHPAFDGTWYLRTNPDVQAEGMNPLVHFLRHGEAEGRRAHKRAAVYTAISGRWDDLRTPLVADPELDYFVFADEHVTEVPSPWVRRRIPNRRETDRLTARFFKAQPHVVLPEYEISLWADGSVQLRDVTEAELEKLAGVAPIAFFAHPERDCAYAEAEKVKSANLEAPQNVDRMVAQLMDHGYPAGLGLCETMLLIRRHRDANLIRAMNDWWQLISTVSYRDQLSFNFVLWKNRVEFSLLPGKSRANGLGYWMGHRPQTEAEARKRMLDRERELTTLLHQQERRRVAPDAPETAQNPSCLETA